MKAVKGYFTILFDESLNKKCQAKQMDIHVRFWEGEKVVTRYFGSQFLGHATANDMVQHFEESVVNSGLPICNLAQISMDGPSVNWKFFTDTVPPVNIYPFTEVLPRPIRRLTPRSCLGKDAACRNSTEVLPRFVAAYNIAVNGKTR